VVVSAMDDHQVGYFAGRQTWREAPGGKYWVGMISGEPPAPEDLQRGELLAGYRLTLGDGREWRIPVALEPAEIDGTIRAETCLPRLMDLDEQGNFCGGETVVPQFADLQAAAAAYYEAFEAATAGDGDVRFEFEDAAAVTVLQAQYRIDRVEVVMLGLLTYGGPEAANVLNLAIDLPGRLRLQKKRESAGSTSAAGPADGSPSTDPL